MSSSTKNCNSKIYCENVNANGSVHSLNCSLAVSSTVFRFCLRYNKGVFYVYKRVLFLQKTRFEPGVKPRSLPGKKHWMLPPPPPPPHPGTSCNYLKCYFPKEAVYRKLRHFGKNIFLCLMNQIFFFGSIVLDTVLCDACNQWDPTVLHGTCNRPVP